MAAKKPGDDCWGEMDGESAVKLIHALNHEVRRRVLRALAAHDEALSPAVMAKRLDIPLSTVSYHVTILKRCNAVEGAGEKQIRGAVEHFYKTLLEENPVARTLLKSTRKIDGDDVK
jgi:DNA-binding transcriptional ArsR family regulator